MLQGILCLCVVEWKWDLIEPCIICCHIKVTLISFISLSLLHLQYLWVNISEQKTAACFCYFCYVLSIAVVNKTFIDCTSVTTAWNMFSVDMLSNRIQWANFRIQIEFLKAYIQLFCWLLRNSLAFSFFWEHKHSCQFPYSSVCLFFSSPRLIILLVVSYYSMQKFLVLQWILIYFIY